MNKSKKRLFFWKAWEKKRSYSPEIMDDFSIRDERLDQALKELKIINKLLGGNSTSNDGLRYISKIINSHGIKILDTGAGASDILLSKKNSDNQIFSIDINKRACIYTKQNSQVIKVICGDARFLPFKEEVFDIVHASLFLHHFTEEEIKLLIKEFLNVSKYGIIINDLRRSVWAYLGIKLLTSLFSRSEMVKNDAPLSVKKGFVKTDLIKILSELQITAFLIKPKWAFRWLVVIYKNEKKS